QLLSARKDGILNIYDGFERNQILSSLDEHLDAINSLAISDKYIATAGNDGKVNVFDTKNNSFSKILLRSQVPVRDIDIDSNGSKVAIATDENTIRIVLINDVTNIVSLEGHQFTAKCVKFDPKNEYLLTSACDGTVNIWDMRHHATPKLIKTFSRQFSTTGPDQLQSTILAWHPIHGNQFAMPGKNGSLHLVQRQKWSFVMTLKDTNNESNKDEINAIAWSSNGKYIATSAWQSSKLVIWDLTAKKLLTQKIMEDVVTAFVWNPNRNELIYTVSGRDELFYWKEPIPLSMKDPNSKSTTSSLPSEFTGSLRDEFDTELDHDDIGEDVDDDIVEIEDQGVNLDDDLFSEMESVADQERPPQQQQQHKVSRPAYRN
ncbi:WD40-repeat-containing domain protein, partial [Cunninghamella echinulata]